MTATCELASELLRDLAGRLRLRRLSVVLLAASDVADAI
jgi:hypothetical protein